MAEERSIPGHSQEGVSFKKLAQLFADNAEALPSDLVGSPGEAMAMSQRVLNLLRERAAL